VRAVVVHDQMHIGLDGPSLLDGAQKAQELLGPMPSVQLPDHLAGANVEGRKRNGLKSRTTSHPISLEVHSIFGHRGHIKVRRIP